MIMMSQTSRTDKGITQSIFGNDLISSEMKLTGTSDHSQYLFVVSRLSLLIAVKMDLLMFEGSHSISAKPARQQNNTNSFMPQLTNSFKLSVQARLINNSTYPQPDSF